MTPSPSFPTNLQQPPVSQPNNFFANFTPTTANPVQSPLNLNNSFLGGLGQMSNATNRVPMNQMRTSTQPQLQTPLFMQPMVNSPSSNQNKTDKPVSLSAQEINDFLS